MALFRTKAEQKLVEKGLDPARLPPGQYLTEKWPVLHAGTVPDTDLATWDFRVFGAVERELVLDYDALHALLTPEHGWPLRLVVPSRYFWKSAKWLRGLELRATDQPGFWERYGYHNEADYRQEQRYGF